MNPPDTDNASLLTALATLAAGIGVWFKHRSSENISRLASREERIDKATQALLDNQSRIIEEQNEKIARLEGRIDQVTTQVSSLMMENLRITTELKHAEETIERLQNENLSLRTEVSLLRSARAETSV